MTEPSDEPHASRERVNLEDKAEVAFWCSRWGVSEDALRQAVLKRGPMVVNVGRELTGIPPQD
ncbi:MAG: DUF3606 domain-containing protein [Alphaproteobacteria bacterium]|nr:DUF3606 domain-containing protein [Alphaproteobacteria bacterium]